ncbi:MAG: two-component regulator propeller domain-containing protein [Bacteroidota bacterium]
MKGLPLYFFFILAIKYTLPLTAQSAIRFNCLTSKDGLAGDIVYSLLQDKEGFLWIGTHRGLNRYDGYHFRLYAHDPKDSNSLSGTHIHCIKEDIKGMLWIGTEKGLNSLDPLSGKIHRYPVPREEMPEYIKDILLVNDSILLIYASTYPKTSIYVFNKTSGVYAVVNLPEKPFGFAADEMAKFATDKNGLIYLAGGSSSSTKEKVYNHSVVIDWQLKKARFISLAEAARLGLWQQFTNQIYFDASSIVWATTNKNIYMNGKKIGVKLVSDDNNGAIDIHALLEEPGKYLWMAGQSGLIQYDYQQGSFYQFRHANNKTNSLPVNSMQTIIRDRHGVYWVGTFGGGLCYFKLSSNFKNVEYEEQIPSFNKAAQSMNTLRSGSLLVKSLAGNQFTVDSNHTVHKDGFENHFKQYDNLQSVVLEITGNPITYFTPADSAYLCFILSGAKPQNKQRPAVTWPLLKNFLNVPHLISSAGKFWLRSAYSFEGANNYPLSTQQQMIQFAVVMPDGNFLTASINGLHIYDTKKKRVSASFLPAKDNPYSISSSSLKYLFQDKKGNYWIATADAGLDYWDRKANRFYNYSVSNGLLSNTVNTIQPDARGCLWLGTSKGLSCFDTTTKTFLNFDQSDGLINTGFNSLSACAGKDGTLYFGGMNGIDYFHPDSLILSPAVPPVLIAGFAVHGNNRLLASSTRMPASDNNILIEYTTNNFLLATKTVFRYQLKGIDNNWIYQQGANTAQYSKLPPGNYRFTVQATYDRKQWSKPGIFSFTILTPWYRSWWFLVVLLLIAALGIYLLFRYKLEQQAKLYKLRNRIHRDLHDDIGASLSSVKAYAEIIHKNPGNTIIAGLINETATDIIEQLDVIAWASSPQHDSFGSLTEKISRYAAPACAAKNSCFQIRHTDIDKTLVMPGEIRQALMLVAKEAINNSCKYAGADNCCVTAGIQHNTFIMEITDDGKGFNGSVNGTGNGLKNMRQRIEEIGGTLLCDAGANQGVKITIRLPFPFKLPNTWDRKTMAQ